MTKILPFLLIPVIWTAWATWFVCLCCLILGGVPLLGQKWAALTSQPFGYLYAALLLFCSVFTVRGMR